MTPTLSNTDGSEFQWRMEPHVCRICYGRLLSRGNIEGKRVLRCSNCGTEVVAARVSGLCCCGITLRGGRNAGVRCITNPRRSPEMPSEIVVQAADVPAGVRTTRDIEPDEYTESGE